MPRSPRCLQAMEKNLLSGNFHCFEINRSIAMAAANEKAGKANSSVGLNNGMAKAMAIIKSNLNRKRLFTLPSKKHCATYAPIDQLNQKAKGEPMKCRRSG